MASVDSPSAPARAEPLATHFTTPYPIIQPATRQVYATLPLGEQHLDWPVTVANSPAGNGDRIHRKDSAQGRHARSGLTEDAAADLCTATKPSPAPSAVRATSSDGTELPGTRTITPFSRSLVVRGARLGGPSAALPAAVDRVAEAVQLRQLRRASVPAAFRQYGAAVVVRADHPVELRPEGVRPLALCSRK